MKQIELCRRSDKIGCGVTVAFFAAWLVDLAVLSPSGLAMVLPVVLLVSPIFLKQLSGFRKSIGAVIEVDQETMRLKRGDLVAWTVRRCDVEGMIEHYYTVEVIDGRGARHLVPAVNNNRDARAVLATWIPQGGYVEDGASKGPLDGRLAVVIGVVSILVLVWGSAGVTAFMALTNQVAETLNPADQLRLQSMPFAAYVGSVLGGIVGLSVLVLDSLTRWRPRPNRHTVDWIARPLPLRAHLLAGEASPWYDRDVVFRCVGRAARKPKFEVATTWVGLALFGSIFVGLLIAGSLDLGGPWLVLAALYLPLVGLCLYSMRISRREQSTSNWEAHIQCERMYAKDPISGATYALVSKPFWSQPYLWAQTPTGRWPVDPGHFLLDPPSLP